MGSIWAFGAFYWYTGMKFSSYAFGTLFAIGKFYLPQKSLAQFLLWEKSVDIVELTTIEFLRHENGKFYLVKREKFS